MRVALTVCAALFALVSTVSAQATPPLNYDVVSIKLSHPLNPNNQSMTMLDTTLVMENIAMKTLIKNAYGVREELILGLPSWTSSTRYDINAKISDADPKLYTDLTREQRRTLIANLLADRFQMKSHIEHKTLPVYELIVAKDGPVKDSPNFKERAQLPPDPEKPTEKDGRVSSSQRHFDGDYVGMWRLAGNLEEVVGRNVIDKTGLEGRYDLHLRWTPNDAPNNTSDPNSPPEIFTALQDQLGLNIHR